MKTVAIIQARLNSSRLHQKMLLPLLGKSMLFHVIERVKRVKLLDDVVVTVPIADAITFAPIINETEVKVHFRPEPEDENDLVKAYYEAAKAYDADVVVRAPADNPCVEPGEIDRLLPFAIRHMADPNNHMLLCQNNENPSLNQDTYGGEVYSMRMLDWMNNTIKASLYREHLHRFWYDMNQYLDFGTLGRPDLRLDVNTQADYDKINDIYNHFGHNHFHITEVIKYLDGEHEKTA